jgi:DNA-binding NarL/FixJ family response regulator
VAVFVPADQGNITNQPLTSRERDILRRLAAGESNREIADHFYITPATVASHVAHIYRKLGVNSRARASAYAHRHGLA